MFAFEKELAMSEVSIREGCWADNLVQNREGVSWLWEGYLALGNVTLLTSQWKSGKTTLLSILLSRMAQGGALANLAVQQARAVVISEESPELWAPRHQLLKFPNAYLFCQPFRTKPSMEQWLGMLNRVERMHQEEGVKLAVVDTLSTFLPGRNEASAPVMMEALLPLQTLTALGMAVLLNHHPRKGQRLPGQAARGSGALAAFVDIIMEKDWCGQADEEDRRRKILAFSRHGRTPRQRVIELNTEGTDYLVHGTFHDDEFVQNWDQLRLVMEDARDWMTRQQLLADWPADFPKPAPVTLARWLKRAVALGQVIEGGTGKKNDSYRYALPGKEAEWKQDPMYELEQKYKESVRMVEETLSRPLRAG